MAKIRHEINILDSLTTLTAAADNSTTVSTTALWQWDPAKYSGTITAYLEVVAKRDSGTSTFLLSALNVTDGNLSVNLSVGITSSTYARNRGSAATSMPTTAKAMSLSWRQSGAGAVVASIKAVRVIIIQDTGTDPLVSCESQIEIGNQETGKTNTTASPLINPKYWYYDSDKWDGDCSFYAEVTLAGSSSSHTKTIILQEDNGSFGGWTNKITIVNAATTTTATRIRSAAFTPTPGRNYRIVGSISSTMSNYSIYNAKIIVQQSSYMDSYDVNNETGSINLLSGLNDQVAQSFTGDGRAINAAQVSLSKSVGATGTVKLYLYAHSGTFGSSSVPTGSPLATSEEIDLSLLTTTNQLITFQFPTPYITTNGTKYCLAVTREGVTAGNILVGRDDTSPTHGGNESIRDISTAVWTAVSAQDMTFRIITNGITKLEPQYLLANTAVGAGTGLQDFDTLFNPAEWDGVSNEYYHEANNVASGTSDAKLQTDPNGTPADVTGSTITDIIERERSSALTMPVTAETIDVNQTGT